MFWQVFFHPIYQTSIVLKSLSKNIFKIQIRIELWIFETWKFQKRGFSYYVNWKCYEELQTAQGTGTHSVWKICRQVSNNLKRTHTDFARIRFQSLPHEFTIKALDQGRIYETSLVIFKHCGLYWTTWKPVAWPIAYFELMPKAFFTYFKVSARSSHSYLKELSNVHWFFRRF